MFKTLAIEFLKRKLKEPSTYAGIVAEALLALHYTPPADLKVAVTQALAALGGVLLVLLNEKK